MSSNPDSVLMVAGEEVGASVPLLPEAVVEVVYCMLEGA